MDRFLLIIYWLISFLIGLIPRFALGFFAGILAVLVWVFTPKVRRVIVKNLSHFCHLMSEQEAKKATFSIYKRFVFYVFLMVKNQNLAPAKLLEQIAEFKNYEEFENLLKRGEKIVFTTAHFSYWELLPSAVALRFGCKLSIVGRALKHKSINDKLVKAREAYGVELIDKKGALRNLLKAAKDGRVLGLVSDQDAHIDESCVFDMYERKVTQSKSAAFIASKINAYLIPVYIYPAGDGRFCIEFFPAKKASEDAIEELSEYQLRTSCAMMERFVGEYFWFHKRFKTFYEDEY